METTLANFLPAYAAKPWRPGKVDCCLYLAAWAIWLGHRDPAEHLRGTYDSEDGFRAIIKRERGLVPVIAGCAARISGRRALLPSVGSIGVIGTNTVDRQFGAIFDGNRWQVRFLDRIAPMSAKPLAIWNI